MRHTVVQVWSNPAGLNVLFSGNLKPDILPDAGRRGIPTTMVGFSPYLLSSWLSSVMVIFDTKSNDVLSPFQVCRHGNMERCIAPFMDCHHASIHVDHGLIVDTIEGEEDFLIPEGRKFNFLAIPEYRMIALVMDSTLLALEHKRNLYLHRKRLCMPLPLQALILVIKGEFPFTGKVDPILTQESRVWVIVLHLVTPLQLRQYH